MRNIFYYFFWWIAGAKIQYLKDYPTEHEKYFHIGMTVFVTWLLATLGGIYAFSHIFKSNIQLAILAGIIWGLIIFNLDRYMMVTIKKHGTELRRLTMGERIGNFIQEIIPTIPRIIIAIILGIIISTPLEVYLFDDLIHNRKASIEQALIAKNKVDIQNNYTGDISNIKSMKKEIEEDKQKYILEITDRLKETNTKIIKIENKLKEINRKIPIAEKNYYDEIKGIGGTGLPGEGTSSINKKNIWNALLKDKERVEDELQIENKNKGKLEKQKREKTNKFDNRIDKLDDELDSLAKNSSEKIAIERDNKQLDNFFSKIQILYSIMEERKYKKDDKQIGLNDSQTIYNIHLVLMTLILIIETSPILFKIISPRGPYEADMDFMSRKKIIEIDAEWKRVRIETKRKHSSKG